ncbi:hypothetical protein RJT34_29721 [Clitoria ternatea]|uniref:Uncharacterized protein n=1 Tax=Clitoria ternatea TaxID=43366 RepID=A0AAN9ET84_CLITE
MHHSKKKYGDLWVKLDLEKANDKGRRHCRECRPLLQCSDWLLPPFVTALFTSVDPLFTSAWSSLAIK